MKLSKSILAFFAFINLVQSFESDENGEDSEKDDSTTLLTEYITKTTVLPSSSSSDFPNIVIYGLASASNAQSSAFVYGETLDGDSPKRFGKYSNATATDVVTDPTQTRTLCSCEDDETATNNAPTVAPTSENNPTAAPTDQITSTTPVTRYSTITVSPSNSTGVVPGDFTGGSVSYNNLNSISTTLYGLLVIVLLAIVM